MLYKNCLLRCLYPASAVKCLYRLRTFLCDSVISFQLFTCQVFDILYLLCIVFLVLKIFHFDLKSAYQVLKFFLVWIVNIIHVVHIYVFIICFQQLVTMLFCHLATVCFYRLELYTNDFCEEKCVDLLIVEFTGTYMFWMLVPLYCFHECVSHCYVVL